jgi:hypothetical protein
VVTAVLESIVCSVIPLYLLTNSSSTYGVMSTFWEAGAMCLTVVVFVINIKVCAVPTPLFPFEQLFVVNRYCSSSPDGISSPSSLSSCQSLFGSYRQ